HQVRDDTNWFGRHPQHRGNFEWLGFIFEGTAALDMVAQVRERFAGPYRLDPQAALLRRMTALTKERTHYVTMAPSECMSMTCGLLAMVLKAAEGEVNAPQTRQLAETAEALLRESPENDWTVGELASRCGVSREHLTRAFKEKYGVSPRRYLGELRIQEACARLRGTQEPIKNIMLDLGYTSHATFNRAFRRYTDATPSEYRDARNP
ncbi:MAG: AraC family transcriptional regulator, partial [Planctomycetota bacterium]